LVYNLRDSNLDRELPRNCILATNIFSSEMTSDNLSIWIMSGANTCINVCGDDEDCQSNCIVDVICPYYFGKSSPIRVSYSDSDYVVVEHVYEETFSGNKLYIHTGDR
jgi:hypothetical protein